MCLILEDRFCVVHIPFVRMVKFKFLTQLPVDHLAHPVGSSLILILCQFTGFIIIYSSRVFHISIS